LAGFYVFFLSGGFESLTAYLCIGVILSILSTGTPHFQALDKFSWLIETDFHLCHYRDMRFALLSHSRCLPGFFVSAVTISFVLNGLAFMAFPKYAHAQNLPGPADIGRIQPEKSRASPNEAPSDEKMAPSISAPTMVPDGAESVHLTLNDIIIDGVTAFSPEQIYPIYESYLGKDVTLDVVYEIAGKVTQLYREAGYFLSLAYIPDQKIKDGVVHIHVVEGHIGTIDGDEKVLSNRIIQAYTTRLMNQKPLKSDEMESFLLRLNDIPGYSFRAVLSPVREADAGVVKLTLIPGKAESRGLIGFDNYSSRFLGPNQLSIFYDTSFLPLQQTNIFMLAGMHIEKLKYLTLGHDIVIAPDLKLRLDGNITHSKPGYTLEPLSIKSKSDYLGIKLEWQYLRQRTENLYFSITADRRNTNTDFLSTPFTRDRIRALRLQANYDTEDPLGGYNWASLSVSRGIKAFGASKENDDNLSRSEAKPDFTKAEISLTRLQSLPKNFSLVTSASGQWSSGALYSSEEFGYGGQSFGRAYDASEITGDHGISAAVEIRYNGIETWKDLKFTPYGFYDIGAVWNEDEGQSKKESGASAGLGTRIETSMGFALNAGLAFPLTRNKDVPVYGGTEEGPRIFLQLTKEF
jgi:hemolysin activation/secretion protein